MNEDPRDDQRGVTSQSDLVELLAPALGEAKATEVLRQAARNLGLPNGRLTHKQALLVLDKVAHAPGLVGISARFVRSRLILKWGG